MKKLAKILSLSLALVMCAVILTACGASADSVKKKYEDDGYTVQEPTKEELEQIATQIGAKADDIEWAFGAIKDNKTETAICFKDAKKAEEAESKAKELLGPALGSNAEVKLDGKVLYVITSFTSSTPEDGGNGGNEGAGDGVNTAIILNDIKTKYENAGYKVSVMNQQELEEQGEKRMEWLLMAEKNGTVTVTCYKKVEDAKLAEQGFMAISSGGALRRDGRILYVGNTSEDVNIY